MPVCYTHTAQFLEHDIPGCTAAYGGCHGPGDDIAHFNGLGKRSPALAFSLLVAMLSLAGVPFTAGFLGKFFVFEAAMQQGHYVLVGLGILTVAAGFYYYLKVVRAMYWMASADDAPILVAPFTKATIGALVAAILLLGIYPQPFFNLLKDRPAQLARNVSK